MGAMESANPQGVESAAKSPMDPLSGSTALLLYFTPSVTGSAAWEVGGVTNGAGSTTASIVISKGQIVAAAQTGRNNETGIGPGASELHVSAGGELGAQAAAVAGVLVFVAAVALL